MKENERVHPQKCHLTWQPFLKTIFRLINSTRDGSCALLDAKYLCLATNQHRLFLLCDCREFGVRIIAQLLRRTCLGKLKRISIFLINHIISNGTTFCRWKKGFQFPFPAETRCAKNSLSLSTVQTQNLPSNK